MSLLVDSHAHLDFGDFDGGRESVLQRARDAGVVGITVVASDRADSEAVAAFVRGRSGIWGTAGIHPHEAEKAREGDLDIVARSAQDLARAVALVQDQHRVSGTCLRHVHRDVVVSRAFGARPQLIDEVGGARMAQALVKGARDHQVHAKTGQQAHAIFKGVDVITAVRIG